MNSVAEVYPRYPKKASKQTENSLIFFSLKVLRGIGVDGGWLGQKDCLTGEIEQLNFISRVPTLDRVTLQYTFIFFCEVM